MIPKLATIQVLNSTSEFMFEPSLTEEEVEDLSAGLPDGLDIVVAPSRDRRDSDKLAMSASVFTALDMVVWLQALGAAFFTGFVGAAGKSAWEALCDAVGRIVDHQLRQGVAHISVENRLMNNGLPVLVRMETARTKGGEFSEKELRTWYRRTTKKAQRALAEATPLFESMDPETQMVVVDLNEDKVDVQVCDRDVSLARWTSLTRP